MTRQELHKYLRRAGKGFIACSIEPVIKYKQGAIDKATLIANVEQNFKNNTITTKDFRLNITLKIVEANKHIEALENIQNSTKVEKQYRDLATKTLNNLRGQR